MRLALLSLCGCAALLAGCSKPLMSANAAPANAAAPAAEPATPATPATPTAATMPTPKGGLWRRVSVQDGGAPSTDTKCLDGKPIDPMSGGPKCASLAVAASGDGVSVDADCPANGVEAKMHMSLSGDYQTSFVTDATMTMSSPGQTPVSMHNHSVWTYVGACPAG